MRAEMLLKSGRYGSFLGCSRYPECNGTQPLPTGVKCPEEKCGGDVAQKGPNAVALFMGVPSIRTVSLPPGINHSIKRARNGNNPYVVEKVTRKGRTIKCPACGSIEESDEG